MKITLWSEPTSLEREAMRQSVARLEKAGLINVDKPLTAPQVHAALVKARKVDMALAMMPVSV
jgi:hypothetical protein